MNGETKMPRQRFLSLSLLATGLLLSGLAPAQTYSKTETIAYHDNTSKWILGQTASVTCTTSIPSSTACDGDMVSETTFDPTYAVPLTTFAFDKLQQTLTYDTTSSVASGQSGTLKTVSDGRDSGTFNTTVTFTDWKRGIPGRITYPIDGYQEAVINDHGWITSVKDEVGYITSYTYDAMGRLASINYPDETSPALTYNNTTISFVPVAASEYGIPAGHWRQIVDTGNGRQVTYFDAMWRPLVEDRYDEGNVAATRSVVAKRYDAAGRLAFQSYPRSSITTYADTALTGADTTYDALGRIRFAKQDSELGVLQTETRYLDGFRTQVINPRAQSTITSYLAWDQPSTDFPVSVDLPEGARTTITRDPFGKPLSLRRHNDANTVGITRTYAYNGYQELCRTVEPETGATLMGYDAAGNLAWSASGLPDATACDLEGDTAAILARRATRTYDPRNRVKTLDFADGEGDTTYSYTPDSLLASTTSLNGGKQVTNTYLYNNRRLLSREALQHGAVNWPIDYSYNANGHLASQDWHGLAVAYAPNALGQPTKAGTFASGVTYHPNGAMEQFTYGNGIVHTMTQNARGLPDVSRDAYGATEFIDDGYDYDGNGNVAAISDGATTNAHGNRTMTYDGLDRLKSAAAPAMFGGTISYTYDVLDNIQTLVGPGRNLRYCYDANFHLTFVRSGSTSCSNGAATTAMTYDVQGNLDIRNNVDYDFDLGNRLRGTSGGISSSYVYDGHGRRVLDVTTGSKYSHYTLDGRLAMTSDLRAGTVSEYIQLNGSLVAIRERNAGVHTHKYQHTDALGSPVVITDDMRVKVEETDYEPYGRALNRPLRDGPGFTGHVEDAATGLVYAQQRYYDPMIGRFLSVDPLTADSTTGANFNRYKYAANNPYRFTDPDGRADWEKLLDSFSLEIAQSVGLTAEIRVLGGKLELGTPEVAFGFGGTAALDGYVFSEATDWNFNGSIGNATLGIEGQSERLMEDRGGPGKTVESEEGSWRADFKGVETTVSGTSIDLGASAGVFFFRADVNIDVGQAIQAIFEPETQKDVELDATEAK